MQIDAKKGQRGLVAVLDKRFTCEIRQRPRCTNHGLVLVTVPKLNHTVPLCEVHARLLLGDKRVDAMLSDEQNSPTSHATAAKAADQGS